VNKPKTRCSSASAIRSGNGNLSSWVKLMSGKNDHKAIAKEAQKAKQKLDKKRYYLHIFFNMYVGIYVCMHVYVYIYI
jgi:hypothetical protein